MSGMVERVARAMLADELKGSKRSIESVWAEEAPIWLSNARAAIAAMREPTEAMLDCGVAFALQASVHGLGGWSNYIAEKHRAMIDAELANASPSPSPGGEVAR